MRFLIHSLLWITSVFFSLILFPIKLINLFKSSKKCPPIYDDLLLISGKRLAEMIRKKQISSKTLIESYVHRIRSVNPVLNAVVEDRFQEAILDATNVDLFLSKTTLTLKELKETYPLLGLPITIKEAIALEGLSFNGGVKKEKNVAEEDSQSVRQIKEAGGIPLLVSNTPELCLNWETSNKVTGRTVNPYDTRRTCGGSSGGEAALLGSGSSVLGLGSDLCGSIRLPAYFCGIYGHKPTGNCISIDGIIPSVNSKNELFESAVVVGLMTRYAEDLSFFFDVLLKPEIKESFPKIEIPFKFVKVFYAETNDDCMTHAVDSEIIKIIRKVINYFKINGNYVKEAKLEKFSDSIDLAFLPLLSIKSVETVFQSNSRNLIEEIIRTIFLCSNVQPTAILFEILYSTGQCLITKERLEAHLKIIDEFRSEIDALLGDDGILIFPVFPSLAHFHGEIYSKTMDSAYMTIFNVLGIPSTACPIGFSPNGLPIGIQVVANAKMDRLCFMVAEELEKEFGGWRQPKFSDSFEKV